MFAKVGAPPATDALTDVAIELLKSVYPNVPLIDVWIDELNTLSPTANNTLYSESLTPAFQ